jgi:hypothetical protein
LKCLTGEDIASFCDRDHETIAQIERRALEKARKLLKCEGIEAEFAASL